MAHDPSPFRAHMREVAARNDIAIRRFVAQFEPVIRRKVERHWQPALNPRCDPDDVIQEVWLAFFSKARSGEAFAEPGELCALLGMLARDVTIDMQRRHLHCGKRAIGRQRSLHHLPPAEADTLTDRAPSPADMVGAEDACRHLVAAQAPVIRSVLELLQQGFTQVEIGERLALPLRTVHCFLEGLRGRVVPEEGDERPDLIPGQAARRGGVLLTIAC